MAAREEPIADFGLMIAYLIPGATVLFGFSQFSDTLRQWLGTIGAETPTIGGFLYLTVASLAAGMTVSAVRWMIVDTVHQVTGLRVPALDFTGLGRNVDAFAMLVEVHYRHYLYYANMAVATVIAYACYRVRHSSISYWSWIDAAVLVLEIIFIATSRDTLHKYYSRSEQLLNGMPQPPGSRS